MTTWLIKYFEDNGPFPFYMKFEKIQNSKIALVKLQSLAAKCCKM